MRSMDEPWLYLLVLCLFAYITSTDIVLVTTDQFQQYQRYYRHIVTSKIFPPSWIQSQKYCQSIYGTELAFYTDPKEFKPFLQLLQDNEKLHVGLQYLNGTWMTVDGTQCPVETICVDAWEYGEPSYSYNSETCAEINKHGELNDIICDIGGYGWTAVCTNHLFIYNAIPNMFELVR